MPRSPEWSLPFRLFNQNIVRISCLPACYMPRLSHPWFHHPNNLAKTTHDGASHYAIFTFTILFKFLMLSANHWVTPEILLLGFRYKNEKVGTVFCLELTTNIGKTVCFWWSFASECITREDFLSHDVIIKEIGRGGVAGNRTSFQPKQS
jgi:hypothetical protein